MTVAQDRRTWAHPPIDDVGYRAAADLLALPDTDLVALVAQFERTRYRGWRNHLGRWRATLGLDTTRDADVLDYGCGVGVEALQYARAGNRVHLADIVGASVQLANRIIRLHGHQPAGVHVISGHRPYLSLPDGSLDVVHCCGVLHHARHPTLVVEQMARWLRPDGQLRLMCYSDVGWRIATGTEPPAHVEHHPAAEQFRAYFDGGVGLYADWYDQARLQDRFDAWFDVVRCEYLTPDGRYLAAVLRRRP